MPPVVALVAAGAEIAGGFAAATAIGATTFAEIAGGLAMVGGALSAVGSLTGNTGLSKIGSVVGLAGGAGLGVGALTGALTEASGTTAAAVASTTADTATTSATTAADTATTAADTAGTTAGESATGSAGANANVASNGAINRAGPAAEQAQAQAAANSPLAGTASAPAAPTAPGAVAPSGAPITQGAAPGSAANPMGPPSDMAGTGGPMSGVRNWYSSLTPTGKLEAIKTGSGILQGVMGYIAPSPMDRAKINEMNANMDRLHWEQSLAAAHNTALGAMTPGTPPAGQATWGPRNTPVNAAPAGPQATGYQPAQVSQMTGMPQLGNPNAQPGILQSNMQLQG